MKVSVRFTDGTKELLDDHSTEDNTAELSGSVFRQEYITYIEGMFNKKVSSLMIEVVVVAENISA